MRCHCKFLLFFTHTCHKVHTCCFRMSEEDSRIHQKYPTKTLNLQASLLNLFNPCLLTFKKLLSYLENTFFCRVSFFSEGEEFFIYKCTCLFRPKKAHCIETEVANYYRMLCNSYDTLKFWQYGNSNWEG